MIDIRHRIGIREPQERVHQALATADGVASWWTGDVRGDAVPFEAHCSTKWAYFLLGLKSLLEGGQATPYPGDLKISSWG